jgi:hypothetical protein
MNYKNLTPHTVRCNDEREFAPSGQVARVSSTYTPFDENGVCAVQFGEVAGLPAPADDTIYIVSGLVAAAAKRPDVVAPATGHPATVRKDGQVWSVPGFVRG